MSALAGCDDLTVDPIDYRSAYPQILHPATEGDAGGRGELHWANPFSWRRIARRASDVVHIQHWSSMLAVYLWPFAVMARRAGKRVAITVHNPAPHESLLLFDVFERGLLKAAHTLIVHDVNGAIGLRQRLLGLDIDTRVIPHGIRLNPMPGARVGDHERFGFDAGRRYVVLFGNLRGYKGVTTLLRAWSQVAGRVADADLVIAGRLWEGGRGYPAKAAATLLGTKADSDRLKAAMAMPELAGRVHLREGFLPDDDIDALLRLAEMAVFPYERFSSQSGAACRAAGMGCPVLVSNLGGLPDLAIGPDWIIEPGDVQGLAAALHAKLAPGRLGDGIRMAQIQRVSGYEWSKVGRQHADLYRELIP
ncbi:glycosyltransferase family 4 protein [Dyella sp.]|uniref:glycosyltransferase family 4 protein n=1 Tax=Dyella sp. TaxID=1869338 RepID=UPI003F7F269C